MKTMARTALSLCFIAASMLPARGTELVRKSLEELSRESEAIVFAEVLANRCAWNEARTLIWTTTTLRIRDSWKGELSGLVEIAEPGGEVPPVGQCVPGMARYRRSELVVVFLKKDVLGQWRTHGCAQGRFAVWTDEEDRQRLQDSPWTHHVVDEHFRKEGEREHARPEISEFREKVQRLVANERKGGR